MAMALISAAIDKDLVSSEIDIDLISLAIYNVLNSPIIFMVLICGTGINILAIKSAKDPVSVY